MQLLTPELPPLLTGHPVVAGEDVMRVATDGAMSGRLGAGDLCWSGDGETAAAAVVLEPEGPLFEALQMVPLTLVAIGDALGAIGPPNLEFGIGWPATLLANGGEIGAISVAVPDGAILAAVPDWLVVGYRVALTLSEDLRAAPGTAAHLTALSEEGGGDIDAVGLISAVSRHFLSWLDAWEHEGFAAVHPMLTARLGEGATCGKDRLIGIDEGGGAIVASAGGTRGVSLAKAMGVAE